MSTRGAFGFRVNGVDKVMYNHFDSYPEGLGATVVSWLRSMSEVEDPLDAMRGDSATESGAFAATKQKAESLTLVDGDTAPTEAQQNELRGWAIGNQSLDDWHCLLRKTQGNPEAVLNCGYMADGSEFLGDSLFCEYAYIVDFDDGTLEVYRGFQEQKHDLGRYCDIPPDRGYYPVALVGTFQVDCIPEDWAEQAFPSEEDDD